MYFWAGPSQIPEEIPGVPIFSTLHLLWLTAVFLSCLAVCFLFIRLEKQRKSEWMKILGTLLLIVEITRLLLLAAVGDFSLSEALPLQLCDVMVFVECYAIRRKNAFSRELCFALGLPGALSALITPGETGYPMLNIHYLLFIFIHLLLFLLPCLMLLNGFRPSIRRLPACFAFLLVLAAMDYVVNTAVKANYLFLQYAPQGSILEPLQNRVGNWYLPALAVLVWGIWGALYGIYFLFRHLFFRFKPNRRKRSVRLHP